jgi:hypothetical protein
MIFVNVIIIIVVGTAHPVTIAYSRLGVTIVDLCRPSNSMIGSADRQIR